MHESVTLKRTYQLEEMPFGLMNAPFILQQIMDTVLKNISLAQAYLANIAVHSKTMGEDIIQLQKVFTVISGHRLKLKISKSQLSKNKVERLGNRVSPDGVAVELKKVIAI